MAPPIDDDPSSFLFGLNQFPSPYSSNLNQQASSSSNNELGAPNSLLLGLDPFSPSAQNALNNPQQQQQQHQYTGMTPAEDDPSSNFADQLALWTNANFSFDGPTGHALLAEEDEKKDDNEGDSKKDQEGEGDGERDIFGMPVNRNGKTERKKRGKVDREMTMMMMMMRKMLIIQSKEKDF